MPSTIPSQASLVTIIIPSYNHGHYLKDAVNSIRQQNYPAIEIIIIDDGSTDDTQKIVKELKGIRYIYQTNKGLSVARNAGIQNSTGEYLIFLDADDWLYPDAITTNLAYLQKNEQLAFVSGAFSKKYMGSGESEDEQREIQKDHYLCLLQGNYIGVPATVLYRRSIFSEFLFDSTVNACADYDLYLHITRKYPVAHHTNLIAAYRIHDSNMSGNIPMMLSMVLKVLDRQKENLRSIAEKKAFVNGHKIWKAYYCHELYNRILLHKSVFNIKVFLTFLKHQPKLLLDYFLKN